MKVLYLLPSANIFGGTAKKTLDLIKYTKNETFVYFWSNNKSMYNNMYTDAGAYVYDSSYGRNVFKHLKLMLKIIDDKKINLVQTQFSFGELLAFLIKLIRPNIKVVVAFVGALSPAGLKKYIISIVYKKVDAFVFISEYVKKEKIAVFKNIKKKYHTTIYNGTKQREILKQRDRNDRVLRLLSVSGLNYMKNLDVLIDAISIIVYEYKRKNVKLYIAGDGPLRLKIEKKIISDNLTKNIVLLGYKRDIGGLLKQSDLFVHPSHVEGFGIAVAEAMMAEKPIIVSNAGALPELVENGKSGIVTDPFDAIAWAKSILRLLDNRNLANDMAHNAKLRAEEEFSVEKFVSNYEEFYCKILGV